uniref:Uncharacterized protein n=1 Tax=Timspurckia oligopyrenoides TaxID=708627 RepID=A0A6T6N8Y9_9RHOD|mmetsp:Transcript_8995/g.16204  ORF Transcript_8995/g.16204 Transcript_8995/m.16204 type:complete len:240 (+) Transcript_8995:266-985(+)|eukprot:CAMPEP_0182447104 /NCGR_PEP_ID=MMETSP1172-20130603/11430_1 /TAXON_ID=708627 /ORGANISM="Timspurckia oligopyrenoides, Strain CCMP3278" /LENGTH=239 /DNA_ID=CAMNT_0024643399 /DNA_START=208 /DNA_END=927 /DNA_ORIENTATION=+
MVKFSKRTASLISLGLTAIGIGLVAAALSLPEWITYAPPPANPIISFVLPTGAREEWYYNSWGLWEIQGTRVEDGLECAFTLTFSCSIAKSEFSGDCGFVNFIAKTFDPLESKGECQKLGATRALLMSSPLILCISVLFLFVTVGRSSAPHSLGAAVALMYAGVSAFISSMLMVSLRSSTSLDNDQFSGSLTSGFILALIGALMGLASAVICIVVAEKGKSRLRYSIAEDDEEEEDKGN